MQGRGLSPSTNGSTLERVNICGIVVLYNPSLERLDYILCNLHPQVNHILLLDNSESPTNLSPVLKRFNSITYHAFYDNKGIAYAHNYGVRWAKKMGFTHVLLLDQDSNPDKAMVHHLVRAIETLGSEGKKIAAVGPRLWDYRNFTFYPCIKFIKNKLKKIRRFNRPFLRIDFLPASGSLIPLKCLYEEKPFSEDLFIDYVDFDWCVKMAKLGFELYVVKDAILEHSIGDSVRYIWLGKKYPIFVHNNPIRQYYIMRNRILLYKKEHIHPSWIRQDLFKAIAKFILFSLVLPPRRENLNMMIKGVIHALLDKTGKYCDS